MASEDSRNRDGLRKFMLSAINAICVMDLGAAAYTAGALALHQTDYAAARRCYERCQAIWQDAGDRLGVAVAVNDLGIVALREGDYAKAEALFEDSLAIRREVGDARGMAVALGNLGLVAQAQGDLVAAGARYEQSLTAWRKQGDGWGVLRALGRLGVALSEQGEHHTARALLEESVARHDLSGIDRISARRSSSSGSWPRLAWQLACSPPCRRRHARRAWTYSARWRTSSAHPPQQLERASLRQRLVEVPALRRLDA